MSEETKVKTSDPRLAARPMQVDYFAVLSVVMVTLLMLSQIFFLFWLDLI